MFIYVKENYNMDIIEGEKVFSKKKDHNKDKMYIYKTLVCIFSFCLGILRILSSIIY